MLIIIHGDNTFVSSEKLKKLRERFMEAYGTTSLTVLDGDDAPSAATIEQAVRTMPFISAKRMVIVRNVLQNITKTTADAFVNVLLTVPEHTVLIMYVSGRLPESALLKRLAVHARIDECKPFTPRELTRWITSRFTARGKHITTDALSKLTMTAGTDPWTLSHEIEKLSLCAGDSDTVTGDHITAITTASVSPHIFTFVDCLAQRDTHGAVQELQKLRATEHHALYILGMIIRQFRNLMLAREMMSAHGTSQQLARAAGLHPYAAEKAFAQARTLSEKTLTTTYTFLHHLDRDAKRGDVDLDTALDLFVVRYCTSPPEDTSPVRVAGMLR